MPNGTSAPGNVSPAYVLSSGFCPAFAPTNGLTNPARSRPPPCSVSAGAARAGAAGSSAATRPAARNQIVRGRYTGASPTTLSHRYRPPENHQSGATVKGSRQGTPTGRPPLDIDRD